MADIAKIEHVDADSWRAFVQAFDDYNYRQLWDFGIACGQRRKAVSEHVRIYQADQTLGLADVRIKKISGFGTGIAYVNGGPLIRQNESNTRIHLTCVLNSLVAEYVTNRKLLLRIQPFVGDPEWNQWIVATFESAGFSQAADEKQYRTLLVDLSVGEEKLMAGLAKKWRYNLRKAVKEDFTIQVGTSDDLFSRFCEMYESFREKKGFDVDLEPSFYADVQKALPDQERMLVCLAEQEGKLIAGHVSSILGNTGVNLFRAMTLEGARTQVSYLLQWHAIMEALNRNCRYYDMGGIDPDGNPGVYSFKKGVGGTDVTAAGPYEFRPGAFRTFLLRSAEALYRRIHK